MPGREEENLYTQGAPDIREITSSIAIMIAIGIAIPQSDPRFSGPLLPHSARRERRALFNAVLSGRRYTILTPKRRRAYPSICVVDREHLRYQLLARLDAPG